MNVLLFAAVLTLPLPAPVGARTPERSFTAERIALYTVAAADVLTTRVAIRNGAFEGNPIARRLVGSTPSTLKLVGLKSAAIGVIELCAWALRKMGHTGQARSAYWVPAVWWGAASGANLRFVW